MTPLRILHAEAATSFGGQEQYIYRMMNAMRERGHHLEAVCQPHAQLAERLREAGFTVHTTYMDGPVNFVRGVHFIRQVLRRGQFQVLNCHSRRDAVLAGTAGRLAGTPLIVRTRHLAKRIGSLFSYTVIPHRVTTASNFVRNMLIERGAAPEKVATVYPAVDMPELPEASTLREELRLAANDVVIGCVAVMRVGKGHIDLINAAEPLIRERPNVHLVFAGGGSPVFEQVQAHIAQRQLGRRVHLLGQRRDIPNVLAGLDIFALATRSEASGTVFVEAGAAGLPTVGTRVDGVPEMLVDGETGFLVPLDDAPALTEALRRLVDDPALRRRMGEAGRRFCRESTRFTPQGMAESAEACYQRWLGERRP